jgi:hypothetical protein
MMGNNQPGSLFDRFPDNARCNGQASHDGICLLAAISKQQADVVPLFCQLQGSERLEKSDH